MNGALFTGLPPLDDEGVLWVAALDRVPIEERVEWVKTMLARVHDINESRAAQEPEAHRTKKPSECAREAET